MIYLHHICCNTRNCIALDPNILLHDLTGFVSMEHQDDLHMFLILQRPRSHENEWTTRPDKQRIEHFTEIASKYLKDGTP